MVQTESQSRNDDLLLLVMLAGYLSLIRLIIYALGYGAPLSVLGRIFVGPLILPRYDQIFIGPILILFSTAAVYFLGKSLNMPSPIIGGLGTAAAFFTALSVGPSITRWRLTGGHRIVRVSKPAQRRNTNIIQTQP
jgi:hypothetical protein